MARFLIFAVPETFWDDRPRATPPTDDELLREQLREARALRERITAGVNVDSERTRFTETIGRIEAVLLKRSLSTSENSIRHKWDEASLREILALGPFPALSLGDDYFHLLAVVELGRAKTRTPGISVPADPLALGESVYRSEQLTPHLERSGSEFASLGEIGTAVAGAYSARREFLELVNKIGRHGVVEVQVVQDNGHPIQALDGVRPQHASAVNAHATGASQSASEQEQARELGKNRSRRREMVERLHLQVERAVEEYYCDGRGGKVNASNQPHEVTTDVLGEWVRKPGKDGKPARVRIVYADASEAAPFPVCCLGGREKPASAVRVIRVALMSMRHLQIDRTVDMAWFRNREVSQARSLAESDEYCFKHSLAQLKQLARLSIQLRVAIRLHVYHTGFEPASIGFYRAVAAVLADDASLHLGEFCKMPSPWLIVVPHYYRGETNYEPSKDRQGDPIEWY